MKKTRSLDIGNPLPRFSSTIWDVRFIDRAPSSSAHFVVASPGAPPGTLDLCAFLYESDGLPSDISRRLMSFWSNLRNLSKSKSDCVIGGVCGGLGAHSPIPAWMWRAAFLVALLVFGTGGLVYIILWIALPEEKLQPPPTADTPAS